MKLLDRLGIRLSILLITLVPMIIGNVAILALASMASTTEAEARQEVAELEALLATYDLERAVSTEAALYRGWNSVADSDAVTQGGSQAASPMTAVFQAATDEAIDTLAGLATIDRETLDRLDGALSRLRGVPLGEATVETIDELDALADELSDQTEALAQGRSASWTTLNHQSSFASDLSAESLMIGTLYLAGSSSETARRTAAVLIDRTDASYRELERTLDPSLLDQLDQALAASEYMPDLRRQSLDLPDDFQPMSFLGLARAFDDLERLDAANDEIRDQLAADLRADANARAGDARAQQQQMFGLAVLALVLTVGLTFVVGGRITRRVGRLKSAADRISEGELGVLVDDVDGRDELGVLAQAFNEVSATVSLGHDQIAALADGRLSDPVLSRELPGPVGHTLRVALRRLGNTTAELAHRASHDRLTGLLDRRGFHLACAESAAQPGRSVMLIDLDGFKEINDEHGHAAGDVVLTAIADRMSQVARNDDVLARLGGDEFVLVLDAGTDATSVARRLSATIAEPIPWGSTSVSVSASIGWTALSEHEDVEVALERADRAMYEAKRAGKDRVVAAV